MYRDRLELYEKLEQKRDSKIIVYVTGDRRGLETQIHPEVLGFLANHLDAIGNVSKLSLYLYATGGHTLAAWSIVNLMRQYCNTFEVITPSKAHSAGTLICLGADRIIMTKQATLSPIDPSVNTPLNPGVPGGPPNARLPVSVEAINGYVELAKQIGIQDGHDLVTVLSNLTLHVHPLVLGQVFRARSQIRMLGRRLLSRHMHDESQIEKILAFLCSESGSHDYTIFQQEARDELGLNVETPDETSYALIKDIYEDIVTELDLRNPYDPVTVLGGNDNVSYEFPRALIESVPGGSHRFVTVGQLVKARIAQKGLIEEGIKDSRTFEGWKYEH